MSDFRPPYVTTSGDRRRKRSGVGTFMSNNSENETLERGSVTEPQVSGNPPNGQISTPGGQASTVTTETAEICDSCKQVPEPTMAIAICRLCSQCICCNCVDFLPSTFADIEKSDCLFFFCNNCSNLVAKKIREPPVDPIAAHRKQTNSISETTPAPSNVTRNTMQAGQASPANVISAEMINNITIALENLQTKVCNIEDTIANNNGNQQVKIDSLPVPVGPRNKPYSQIARDPRAPPAIVLYQPEESNRIETNVDQQQPRPEISLEGRERNVTQQRPEVTLEGRELVPRPQTAPELLESREKERRKFNVVVQNLPESDAESGEDRKAYDTMEVRCMLAAMRLKDIDVKSVVRLGKKSERRRSLMVTLDTERDQVLKREKFIRKYKCWQKVYIDPDRTPQEQEDFKELRAEFKRRKESGENIKMRDGKILPSSRKNSYLDLETLITQAQEQRSEANVDRTQSVNLINLADSATDIQSGATEVTVNEPSASTSQETTDAQKKNDETATENPLQESPDNK